MQLTIEEQKKVPLLKRTEVRARMTFEGATPERDKVCHALAKNLKADTSLLVVNRILTDFGASRAVVEAQLYDDKDAFDAFSPKIGIKGKEKLAKLQEAKKKAADAKPESV